MAAELDELQIVITSNSKEATDAIDKLVKGLENLNTALGNLDASKVTSFANAMSKLSSIGASTDTTAKAIKGLSSDLAKSFGINTKKGIEDITVAMLALYKASRNVDLNDSMENTTAFNNSIKGLQEAIEANYQYRQSVDETNKKIADFVKTQNKSGQKIAMGEMAQELGEDFKNVSKILGSSFKNKLLDTEATSLSQFIEDMNATLNTDFKTDTMADLKESIEKIQAAILNSKDSFYDYGEAISKGLISGEEAATAAYNVVDKLFALIKEQDKYGASAGLSGLVAAMETISNANIPDMSGFVDAVKNIQNSGGSLSNVSSSIENVAKSVEDIGTKASAATEQVQELEYAFKNITSQIWGNEIVDTGFLMKDIEPFKGVEFPPAIIQPMVEVVEDKLLPAIINVESEFDNMIRKVSSVGDIELVYDEVTKRFVEWQQEIKNVEQSSEKLLPAIVEDVQNVSESVENVITPIQQALKAISAYKKIISDMESGKIPFDKAQYDEAIKGYHGAAEAVKRYKDELLGLGKSDGGKTPDVEKSAISLSEISEKLNQVSEGFEGLSHTFGHIAEKGTELFKALTVPLKMASKEYVEKFEDMKKAVNDFQKNFQVRMKKVSDFWKRTMRTFTFMIIRKIFTAIIKEIGVATQQLALYSNAMGSAFNTDLSHMVADFQYLGRAIVSVFAPLLNYIAPIVDAIVDRIATLLSYIGMLIAALGGATSFTKAKKNIDNYAESLDNAGKSAKNLTMGIDELNILNDTKSGSAKAFDGWEDAFEDVQIPDWIKDLSDKVKGLFKDLFEPIKKAWDLAKDYILDGWKFMTTNMKKLLRDVWRDFMRVWKSDTVVHIFYNLLMILGDIERVIGFIAKRFDEAWNEGEKGYKILSNVAHIVDILVQHLRNVTLYMVGWASRLDFNPLLESLELLTRAFEDLAEFIGQIFEDVMQRVVLKYLKFLIEEGIPHLQHTIAETLEYFDFGAIREKLHPLEDAFEKLLENLDVGKTNALGNLGKQIAEFTDSEDFQNFINTIQHMMEVIDAETVEKILTGIGTGIGHVADALVRFVGSELFNSFLDDLDEWFDNASAEDIAAILERLAGAIALFKFAEFASAGIANFFTFCGLLKSFNDIGMISTNLGLIGEELGLVGVGGAAAGEGGTAAAGGIAAIGAPAATVAAAIALVVVAVYSLIKSFGGLSDFLMEIKRRFDEVKEVVKKFAETIHLDKNLQDLRNEFKRLGDKLGDLKDYWSVVIDIIQFFADALVIVGEIVVKPFIMLITGLVNKLATLADVAGGVGTILKSIGEGITTGDWSSAWEGMKEGGNRIKDAFLEGIGVKAEEIESSMGTGISEGAKRVAGTYANDYSTEIKNLEGVMKDANTEALTNAVKDTNFKSVSSMFSAQTLASLTGSVEAQDYGSLSDVFSGKWSSSILKGKDSFDSANEETAKSGAEALNSTYLDFFTNNEQMSTAMQTYGSDAIKSFNAGMDEEIQSGSISKSIEEAYKQIEDTSKDSFDGLVVSWDEAMKDWWDNHVVVWFDEKKWTEQFEVIHKTAKKGFEQISKAIKTEMDAAAEYVHDSCTSMVSSVAEVIKAIEEMLTALEQFEGFEGKVTFDFGTPGEFATGGFPKEGSLFFAGEQGAEFVSSVNGRTGVVSNDEITGIADAVYETGNNESELLGQLIAIGRAMLNKDPVVLNDKDLAMAVDRGRNQMGMSIIT